MLIIGNLTPDGYLEDAARGSGRGGRASTLELAEIGAEARSRSSTRSASAARDLEECLLIQARHSARTTTS